MAGNISASNLVSPSFIEAKTPQDLQKKMLEANLKSGNVNHYRDIQYVNGKWYTWYDSDQTALVKIQRKELRGGNG